LASGDGDFDILLKTIAKKFQVTTQVYGVPDLTAQSLIAEAGIFNPISENLLL